MESDVIGDEGPGNIFFIPPWEAHGKYLAEFFLTRNWEALDNLLLLVELNCRTGNKVACAKWIFIEMMAFISYLV